MASAAADFVEAHLQWTKEALEIESEYQIAIVIARDHMIGRMRSPGAEADLIVTEFMDEWRALDKKRGEDRLECDARNRGLIDRMRGSS